MKKKRGEKNRPGKEQPTVPFCSEEGKNGTESRLQRGREEE